MSDIVIRPVKPQDAEQYIKLNNLVWRVAYKHIFPEEVFAERDKQASQKIKDFASNVYNSDTHMVYVAEQGSKLIGFISGTLLSEYEHFAQKDYADLMALYIHPDYQGMGIASKLKKLFDTWVKDHGKTKYVIGVLKENLNARRVYEKWGCKLDKHSQPFVKLGVGYDEVFYICDIKD